MVIYRAFDEVLSSWSRVAVLRTLLDTKTGITGNEAARLSGMHPLSALKALTSLEELGIVYRQRGGRDHLFTLNREHFLVSEGLLPMYGAESKFLEAIEDRLRKILRGKVLSLAIFGSVVKKEETPRSDVDLLCVTGSAKKLGRVREILAAAAPIFQKRFGVRLAPLLLTQDEFRKKARSALAREVMKQGKLIAGKMPGELLRGKTR